MRSPRTLQRSALSVLQLVVVLAILLMGLAMLFPVIAKLQESAMRTQSLNNLKHLGLAMYNYYDAHLVLPPTAGPSAGKNGSAHFHILPYIERNIPVQKFGDAAWKNGAYSKVIPAFLDPRDQSAPTHVYKNWLATTNYRVNWMVFREGKTDLAKLPNTSNTLVFAQRLQMCNGQPTAWGYPSIYTWAPMFGYYSEGKFQSAPSQETCDPALAQSIGHEILVTFCDGHAEAIAPDIHPSAWYSMIDPNDGN